MEECSTKHYLKYSATNSKLSIWHLSHFGNTLHNYSDTPIPVGESLGGHRYKHTPPHRLRRILKLRGDHCVVSNADQWGKEFFFSTLQITPHFL